MEDSSAGTSSYDLVVIGAGSGGVRAARIAGSLGARVAVVEQGPLGGTCVNVGCVPKKLLVYASQIGRDMEGAAGFGWETGASRMDWPTLIQNKNREIERLNGIYRRLLDNAGVDLFEGRAALAGPTTIRVGHHSLEARYILVATGGRPYVPDLPGRDFVITSDQAFYLPELPSRVLLVGGGYISVEFAGIFRGMGVDVTLCHRRDRVLRGFDEDIRVALGEELVRDGITLKLGSLPERVEQRGAARLVTFDDGTQIEFDQVMFATGRKPNTMGLGLEALGVGLDDGGAIEVDDMGRTAVDSIFAVGDVTDRITLTPVAIAEGQAVAEFLFGKRTEPINRSNVPSAVFSQPAVATVGLTEAEAREQHARVDVYRSSFRPMKHTMTGKQEKSLVKLVVDAASDRVLGCHVLGPEAGEIVQGFAVALQCGATKAQLDSTIGIHPTLAEELVTLRSPV